MATGIKYSSHKKFTGSKDSSYYDETYFLDANGSMYGTKKDNGEYQYFPYKAEYQIPHYRGFFPPLITSLNFNNALVLGCARGYDVRVLRENSIEAFGIDISEYSIMNCDPSVQDYLYCGDVCDLSMWESKSFDIVFAIDVLEHICVPDLYIALDECTRVSDLVYIGCPVNEDDTNPDMSKEKQQGTECSHVSVYSKDWWIKEMDKRNFVSIFALYFNDRSNVNMLFANILSMNKYTVIKQSGKYRLMYIDEGKLKLLNVVDGSKEGSVKLIIDDVNGKTRN